MRAEEGWIWGERSDRRTHEDKEKRKASIEARRLQPERIPRVPVLRSHLCGVRDVGAVGVEGGDEGAGEGEPEGAWKGEEEGIG